MSKEHTFLHSLPKTLDPGNVDHIFPNGAMGLSSLSVFLCGATWALTSFPVTMKTSHGIKNRQSTCSCLERLHLRT